jgi:TonB-linked SusC/RagA family outer membrane protein
MKNKPLYILLLFQNNHIKKFLNIMRISTFLISLSFFTSFATPSNSQNAKVTINGNNLTVSDFINQVEEQTNYLFVYSKNELDVNNELALRSGTKSVAKCLDEAFDGSDVKYVFENDYIVLTKNTIHSVAQQQGKTITGTVTDNNGEPVIGANVAIKGRAIGTVTDYDGKYTLPNIPVDAVLQVSYIGYLTKEVAVNNQLVIHVILTEDTKVIDEIVVVGYGTQKKVNLTGAVASINAQELQEIPASNLSNALSGRLGGVTITQSQGGRPGNSSTIAIRAKGSWNNTDPLYVIDGVIRDKFAFDGLEAADIENLSVLKDGASAAIYGSRSANGVVLVTTKKGSIGKPLIAYIGTIGLSDATRIPVTENAYEHSVFINDALTVAKVPTTDFRYFTEDELEHLKTHSYNWIDIGWKEPLLSHHSLNVSGGNERVRYFVGGSYYYETGSFDNMKFTKYNLRGNIEANITKDLIASLNLNMDVRNDRKPFWNNDFDNDNLFNLFGSLLQFASPYIPPYTSDGKPVGNYISNHSLELTNDGYNHRRYSNYEANISLEYKIPWVQGLSVKLLYNTYNRHQFTKHFTRPFTVYVLQTEGEHNHIIKLDEIASTKQLNARDWINEQYNTGNNYQLNGFITYNQRFGKHDVGALLVYEQAEGFSDWFRGQRNFYISNAIDQLFAGSSDANDSTVDGSGSEDGRLSYAGRFNYGYADKYLLEASFRYDGSVRFASEQRWGFFPSVSAAWRISEENFFKNHVRFIDYLKLRGSVGLLGNDLVGGWQWMQRYTFSSGAQYGSTSKGIQSDVVPNPYITWEKSLSYNGGLDIGFLDNKLTATIDAFYKHTYDILGSRIASMPSTFGANMPNENYGIVDSKGFEVELGYANHIGQDFNYYVRGNVGYATNKLIKRDEAENLRPYQSAIGYNTDRAMGYIFTDIIRTQADLDALPEGYTIFGATPELGMMNYKDIRGANSDEPDGKVDGNDQEWILNHITPPIHYGFSLGGSWKGLALDIFFQGFAGHQLFLQPRETNIDQAWVNFAMWNDHWTPDNIDAKFPRAYGHQLQNNSTFMRRNASFMRLKNISLSYTVPKSLIAKAGIAQLRFFLTGNNLLLLEDHVKYFDPELGNDSYNIVSYPIMKSYSFGVNLSF